MGNIINLQRYNENALMQEFAIQGNNTLKSRNISPSMVDIKGQFCDTSYEDEVYSALILFT